MCDKGNGLDYRRTSSRALAHHATTKYKVITARVAALLVGKRPFAIQRLIIAVVVLALDLMFRRRRFARICGKAFEAGKPVLAVHPARANRDAPAAVSLKARCVGIEATILHAVVAVEQQRAR